MIGGDGDYFRSLVWGSDRNTFVVSLDEVEETPCVGCLVSRDSDVDVVGSVRWRFAMFFLIKRDEEATSEEWDLAQSELAKEVHCFCALLRPYVLRYPSSFSHWSDHALSGYWCEMVASATSVGECVDCTPPVPPDPRMGYYEYLEARNGRDNYNVWILTEITNFEGLRVTIRGFTSMDPNQSPTVWFQRIGAYNRTDPTNVPANVVYDFTYDYVNKLISIRNVETQLEVYSASMGLQYGATCYNGIYALWYGRNANNISYGRIYSIKIERDGETISDLRPYIDSSGVVGLRDVVTGAFLQPQQNVSITAVGKLDED